MIADLALRWVATVLFALSAAECAYAFTRSHDRPGAAVSQLLHLAMAVAMLVMAWPRGAELPTSGPMFFFLAAAFWFLAGTFRSGTPEGRLVNGYDVAMMSAMAWMYAVMNGNLFARHAGPIEKTGHGMHVTHIAGHPSGGTMAGMEHGMEHGVAQASWLGDVNGLIMVGFVIAAAVWLYRYFAERQQSAAPPSAHFATLCRAMMAAGMAIMFGVMG